jgi:hypothetical protein
VSDHTYKVIEEPTGGYGCVIAKDGDPVQNEFFKTEDAAEKWGKRQVRILAAAPYIRECKRILTAGRRMQ